MLRKQGCTVSLAGEFTRAHKGAINLFLDDIEADRPAEPRFVLALQTCIEDSLAGTRWRPTLLIGTGTEEEIVRTFRAALQKAGATDKTRKGATEERMIGGPWVVCVPIGEAYRLLKQRAKVAGYVVDGRAIYKIAAQANDAEGEA